MNKIRSLLLFCITSMTIAGFTHAHAGNRPGAVTLTLGGGYEYLASKRNIQNSALPIGMLGYNFTNNLGFEALFGTYTTKFDRSQNDSRQVRGSVWLFDGVYRITTCTIVEPFITGGVGVTTLNPNGNDANNEGNINLGVGAQIFAAQSVAFRVDARDLYTIVGGKNDVLLDAGVSFLFDV